MSTAEPSHARPGRRAVSLAAMDGTAGNVGVVERFLAAFDRRWPTDAELDELLAPEIRFVERPSLVSPKGSERDAAAMRAGIEAGGSCSRGSATRCATTSRAATVVTRMRWSGELAIDAGPWPQGTTLTAWCVAHYRLAEGRIVEIEQHDCYEPVETV